MSVNLNRYDTYPDDIVPDEHIEISLKVIRTIRGVCMRDMANLADPILILSECHKVIVQLTQEAEEIPETSPEAPKRADFESR